MPELQDLLIVMMIGVPTFFTWRWVLGKIMMAGTGRNVTIWVATLITVPIIYIAFLLSILHYTFSYQTHPFDKVAWETHSDKRFQYTGDLIKRRLLIGKTKHEVIKILGLENNKVDSDRWIYEVGFVPPMGVDVDILEIKFSGGKVVEVTQRGT